MLSGMAFSASVSPSATAAAACGGGGDGGCGSHSRVGRRQCDASSSRRQHSLARTLPSWSDGFILLLCFLVFLLSHRICALEDARCESLARAPRRARASNCTLHNRIFGSRAPEYGSDVDVKEPRVAGDDAIADAQGLGQSFGTNFASSAFNSASVISSSSSSEAFAAFSAEDFASPSASAAMDATSVPPSFFTSPAAVSFSFSSSPSRR